MSTARRSARAGLDESICDNCYVEHISGAGRSASSKTNRTLNSAIPRAGRSASADIAIQSARIVNAYGSVIQVIGIVVGVIIIVGGFVLAHSSSSGLIAVVGVVVGLLDIAIFAVQGALFRMISNYVIARLEQ